MNSLFIVLPILTILMFDLGLTLEGKDFAWSCSATKLSWPA